MTAGARAGAGLLLNLERVGVAFGEVAVFEELSLAVRHGEFVAVVGPSGCGKTTLLNLCSGWLEARRGAGRAAAAACAWSSSRTGCSRGSPPART